MLRYNSTISVKLKECIVCGKPKGWFSRKRCKECATMQDTLERENEKIEHNEDLSDLIADCDGLFSKIIRLKYSDKNGNCKCYTCPEIKHWTLMQNGHYISRGSMFLRFDERNCKPQCEYCNCHKHGNLKVFAANLEQEQKGITEILLEESHIIYKYTRDELKQLKINLSSQLKRLKP